MNGAGSGGLGAVSFGISEALAILLIVLVVAAPAFGAWKLAKVLLLALKG